MEYYDMIFGNYMILVILIAFPLTNVELLIVLSFLLIVNIIVFIIKNLYKF